MRWTILLDITKLAKAIILDKHNAVLNIKVDLSGKYTFKQNKSNSVSTTDPQKGIETNFLDPGRITGPDKLDAGIINKADTDGTLSQQTLTTADIHSLEFKLSVDTNFSIKNDNNDRTSSTTGNL